MSIRAGELFENALKAAELELRPGAELRVKVRGRGQHLKLVVDHSDSGVSTEEAVILERAKRADGAARPYRPKVSTGEKIRTLRQGAGLIIDVLAKRADLTKGTLSSIERGERPAGLAVLRRIAKALAVPVGVLVDG